MKEKSAQSTKASAKKAQIDIPIQGKIFSVSVCHLRHEDLKFYADNPRVYSALHDNGDESPQQEDIEEHLREAEHVRELRDDIRENGGVIEPLYVKETTMEVVEGNSRLAAYRMLADENALKWQYVKCALLPKEVDDSAIASLLGQLHLKGKKDWCPYERAAFLHRRHHKDKISIPALVKELNISEKTIKHCTAVIDFMIKHKDNKLARWSHYDEMLKSRNIKKAFEDHPGFEETLVQKVKDGEIKAVEVRDKVKVVCATRSEKPIKQFVSGGSLDDALKSAKSLGGDNSVLQRVKRFRAWITTNDAKQDITNAPEKVRDEILFELRKVKPQIEKLLKIS